MKFFYQCIIALFLFFSSGFIHAQNSDLGIAALNSPNTSICPSKPTLLVTLVNYSTFDHFFSVERARIFVDVTGASTQSFTFSINSGTLIAGGSQQYIVANPVILTTPGTHHFNATVKVITGPGEVDTTNNALSTIDILVHPFPPVVLDSLDPICLNAPILALSGGTPIGGTYSGNGVSAGVFDPTIPGIGNTPITYAYTDTNGCTSDSTLYINVNSAPSVSHTLFAPVCTSATAFALSGGTPSGGVYSGVGVSANTFDPSVSGIGTFTLQYIYTNVSGCSDTAYPSQQVYASPPVLFASLNPLCINGSSISLTAGTPTSGTYTGVGVSSGNFDPTVAGVGTHTITYTYTDVSGCTDSAAQTINVRNLPSVTHNSPTSTCLNSGTVVLSGGSPSGGIYNGIGTNGDSTFTPSIPGAGTFTLTYVYSDSIGCTDSIPVAVTVNTPPVVTLGFFSNKCLVNPAFALSGGAPSGGTYFGAGITSNTFTPSAAGAGTHTIYYTYTNPVTTCSDTASKNITVVPFPSQNVNDTTHCIGSSLVLNAGNPGAGYLWSTGSTSQSITLTNNDTVSVTISYGSGCVATYTSIATFVPPPVPYLGEDSIESCANVTVILSGCAGGYSAYSWCNSGATTCSITALTTGHYCMTVTDANGCTGTDSVHVTLVTPPVVSFSMSTTFFCLNDPSFTLSGGIPSGGTYSGPGVSGTTFDPALAGAGTHTITYTYTDITTGCNNYAEQIIGVGCVGVEQSIVKTSGVTLFPNPAKNALNIIQDADVDAQFILISDIQGKTIYSDFINSMAKGNIHTIETAGFSNGVYIIRFMTSEKTITEKFVIQH